MSGRPSWVYDSSEPRRPDRPVPYRFPRSDNDLSETMTILAMFASFAAMLTRYPIWCWVALLMSVSAMRTRKSLQPDKEKSTSMSAWSSIMFAFTATFSVYMPLLQGIARRAPWSELPFKMGKGLIAVARSPATSTA
ncbi:hypothetical protein OIV83_001277 [Microbotryomycetes sp. JL201]|nr:hypothetical protein OIV83_001277 [Microbotryomycetes sp. JL201]